ncbi:hypothetical protein Gbem_3186 [Citrifermentans bemidjiense Bem]|uniref:Uncharacterized protein n=1 Tax=Citrifermentans bemidjiense (strain ATCC BAA-1014 / DSM 16622 / JCM 12645 / Bem) TaxID=404380 RepID=B5E9L3_CITBB|nr:hypothetical protein [Citrifermentans bemidjiense]ACH40187.1 hypothetical protein Gbem_3186 [Citrifermentans bemidjiense Bem]
MTISGAIAAGARRLAGGRFRPLRTSALLLATILLLSGCGDIVWFPPYVRLGTTPDQFTFPAKTGTDKSVTVTSEPITVSGLTVDAPIFVTGSSGSESAYSINGASATSTAGTVKNGDKVTVSHKSAADLGTATQTTLTIGTVSANFVSTNRFVESPVFSTPVLDAASFRVQATLVAVGDGTAGLHVITIKDSLNSTGAQFSVSDNDIPTFYSSSQTVPFLNNRRIFVRNLTTNVDAGATTILTIDGADFVVKLTP